MNDQNPTINQPPVEQNLPNKAGVFLDKVKQILSPIWQKFTQTKFYTNKKIFYPVTIVSGLLFLTILIGLLFGGAKNNSPIKVRPTPTPFITQGTETPITNGDPLSQIEQKLFNLKLQMDEFDVRQSRLQPPAVDFKISF